MTMMKTHLSLVPAAPLPEPESFITGEFIAHAIRALPNWQRDAGDGRPGYPDPMRCLVLWIMWDGWWSAHGDATPILSRAAREDIIERVLAFNDANANPLPQWNGHPRLRIVRGDMEEPQPAA